LGVELGYVPLSLDKKLWQCLSESLDRAHLATMTSEISLDDCIDAGAKIIAGEVRGRLLVDLNRR
jgi:acrylyl-CoA reductase (NADPH)